MFKDISICFGFSREREDQTCNHWSNGFDQKTKSWKPIQTLKFARELILNIPKGYTQGTIYQNGKEVA